MNSNDHGAEPLTDAELDQLDALNRARTPGPFAIAHDRHGQANIYGGPDGEEWIALLPHQCLASLEAAREADARAIVAALNALPALLAEVRAARSAPSPSLAAALDAYGRAYCRAAHLDTQARRSALADAERAVLRCVDGGEQVSALLRPSPAMRAALDAYGRAYCRNAHLDTVSRRNGLAAAEQALLAVIAQEGSEASHGQGVEPDAPRLHIPADLLTRPAGGGVR